MQTIHVPAGQRAEVHLGRWYTCMAKLSLNPKFSEQFSANTRNVELDGEGYFSVQHNEKSPFTVQTPKYTIQVLGTEFNVKAYHNSHCLKLPL